MARVDDSDTLSFLVQRIKGPVELHAGQPEDHLDPFEPELLHERLTAGHACHTTPSLPPSAPGE
jgi:hypothetical protein